MKRIIYIIVALLAFHCVEAQNMRHLFLEMPDSIVPLLTRNNRADCIDFLEAGMKAEVSNLLDGRSSLLKLTPGYLKMKTTSHSEVQMKLLPVAGGDTIICMINTVRAEAADSRIRFYDKEWKELKPATRFFTAPAIKEFFTIDSTSEKKQQMSDIYLVELILAPDAATLQAIYTMPAYMSAADSTYVAGSLHDIKYQWNGKKFVKKVE